MAVRERVEAGIWKRQDAQGQTAYEIVWRCAQGRQHRRRVEGGIRAARHALANEVAKRGRGERVAADPRLRFDDAAQAWWESRVRRLRPTTQTAYAAHVKHLEREFGRMRLADITPAQVARFISRQRAAGLKGWTVKGQVAVLGAIFTFAGRHLGFVGVNPVTVLDRVERPGTEDEKPKRILSGDELQRLLNAIEERHRPVFEFAAETGARLGEVLGVVWREVDPDEGTVTFTAQLDRDGRRVPLKTARSRRTIEVTPALAARLRTLKLASPRSGPYDLVFVARGGTPHDHRNIAGRVLARAVKRAGLEDIVRDGRVVEPAPTFHSLRHTHGSALIAAGWDLEEVSRRLGHSNTATTQRAYIHAYEAARRSDDRRNRLAQMYAAPTTTDGEVVALRVAAS